MTAGDTAALIALEDAIAEAVKTFELSCQRLCTSVAIVHFGDGRIEVDAITVSSDPRPRGAPVAPAVDR